MVILLQKLKNNFTWFQDHLRCITDQQNFIEKKSTSQEPQLALELPQSCSKPEHFVQFTEEDLRSTYCFNIDKRTQETLLMLSQVMFRYVFKREKTVLSYTIPTENVRIRILDLQEITLVGI